jgi:hypothetical protein
MEYVDKVLVAIFHCVIVVFNFAADYPLYFILLYLSTGLTVAWASRFGSESEAHAGADRTIVISFFWPIALTCYTLLFVEAMVESPLYSVCGKVCRFLIRVKDRVDWAAIKFRRVEIHRDKYGILYKAPSPYGQMRFVRVEDSTGVYWLTVPREMNTAKEAVAWTYGINAKEYNPVRV